MSPRRALRVGLTGGLASGKSTVARRLAEAGCTVVDADRLVAGLYQPGAPGVAAVRALFGDSVSTPAGGVDTRRLASLVFADADARRRLETAIHPLVRQQFAALAAGAVAAPVAGDGGGQAGLGRVVVLEATLLVEAGYGPDFDLVVTVEVDPAVQLARAIARGMNADDARARLLAQGDGATRRAGAQWTIRNDDSLADLEAAIDELLAELRCRLAG